MGQHPENSIARWRALYLQRRFSILLGALLAMIAGPILLGNAFLHSFWHDVILSLILLSAIVSLAAESHHRLFALACGIPTVVLVISGSGLASLVGDWVVVPGQFCAMVFFFAAAWIIVIALFRPAEVSNDPIMGAICGYLFLGLGWAMAFAVIVEFQPEAFAISEAIYQAEKSEPAPTSLLIYYSFVTLTTIGYGDISPVAPSARTLAWLEAVSGQFYLAVVVAGLVTVLANGSRGKKADA